MNNFQLGYIIATAKTNKAVYEELRGIIAMAFIDRTLEEKKQLKHVEIFDAAERFLQLLTRYKQ